MQIHRPAVVPLLTVLLSALTAPPLPAAASPKPHTVVLGAPRKVPYTPPEAGPDDKSEDSTTLRVRPLLVDGAQKEWTLGDAHDVTERTFVVRRALRLNDGLPGEPPRWSWQPGPWLMVDRSTGRVTALHLPDFDPQVSDVVWFRDYAAYCGIATTAKGGLVAVVAELGARKAVVQKLIAPLATAQPAAPSLRPPHLAARAHARHHPAHRRSGHHLRRRRHQLPGRRRRRTRRAESTIAVGISTTSCAQG